MYSCSVFGNDLLHEGNTHTTVARSSCCRHTGQSRTDPAPAVQARIMFVRIHTCPFLYYYTPVYTCTVYTFGLFVFFVLSTSSPTRTLLLADPLSQSPSSPLNSVVFMPIVYVKKEGKILPRSLSSSSSSHTFFLYFY